MIATLVTFADEVPRIEKAIDDEFRNSTAQTKTETESAFGLSFVAMLGNVKVFLLGICGAVTFTILLVSANTIAMSVRERVREVGVLKTLGYTARHDPRNHSGRGGRDFAHRRRTRHRPSSMVTGGVVRHSPAVASTN